MPYADRAIVTGAGGPQFIRDILGVADVPVTVLSVDGRDQVVARAFEFGTTDCYEGSWVLRGRSTYGCCART